MTPEELDDIERRATVNGNIRPQRALALVAEVRRLQPLVGQHDATGADHMEDAARLAVENDRLRAFVRDIKSALRPYDLVGANDVSGRTTGEVVSEVVDALASFERAGSTNMKGER